MFLELNVPGLIYKAKKLITKGACQKIYDASKPLYLEQMHLVLALDLFIKVREDMICGYNEVPNKAALSPIAFATKSLYSVKW